MINSTRMKCPRCSKSMIQESYYTDFEMFSGWRCIMCGEVLDPVILNNRRLSRLTESTDPSTGRLASPVFA